MKTQFCVTNPIPCFSRALAQYPHLAAFFHICFFNLQLTMTILIVSSPADPHALCVRWALQQAAVQCEILELTTLPSQSRISYATKAAPANALQFCIAGRDNLVSSTLDFSEVRAVWMRRVLLNAVHFDFSDLHDDDLPNAQQEIDAFIPSLWYGLSNLVGEQVQWLNAFAASRAAQSKLLQLQVAQALGLRTPATLVSNDAARIRSF